MRLKKWVIFFMICVLIVQQLPITIFANSFSIEYDGKVHKYTGRVVKITIDKNEVKTGDMPAIILGDRTLVPAREVFESEGIGAKVDWNQQSQEVYITFQDTFIRLKIDSPIAYVNNKEVVLDVPAKLIRDTSKEFAKTMIPLRFVAEALNYKVEWNEKEYIADLTSPVDIEEEEEEEVENEDMVSDMDSSGSERPLPTPLRDNPVVWMANSELVMNLLKLYAEEPITKQSNGIVKVNSVERVALQGMSQFIIKTDGPISSIDKTIWEDRLIIDIQNASYNLSNSTINYDSDAYIKSVRSSQHLNNVTRVVFDMKNTGVQFKVALSQDRKEIIVTVLNNLIYSLEVGQNDEGDYVKIGGKSAPEVKLFRLSNPDRLVIDVPNTISGLSTNSATVEGQYITEVRTSQFDETTTRVVLVTEGQADYRIETKNGETLIQILEPRYENLEYEHHTIPTITFKKPQNVKLSDLKLQDLYLKKEFIIEMPGDQRGLYGNGKIEVLDSQIEEVVFSLNSKGNTELKIKANNIFAYEILDEGENFVIKAFRPKDKYTNIIVIDAGHGGRDPGASANGLVEKVVNLDIVLYLKALMDGNTNIKAYYTRLDDTYPTLAERVDLANELEADIFLSVHNNAFTSTHNGTETLYMPTTRTPGLDSIELAGILHNSLISHLGLNNRGLKQRSDLYVLKNTKMPAALVEIGFLTSPIDSAKLKSEDFKKKAAFALYEGIVKTFKDYPTGR